MKPPLARAGGSPTVFSFLRRGVPFFDYFEAQSEEIVRAAGFLHDLVHDFSDVERKLEAIREVEHRGDRIIHEIVRRLNTTFITPPSASRAMAEVVVQTVAATQRAMGCLRTRAPAFHEHAVEVNRLENRADVLLRGSLAALFEEERGPDRGHQVEGDLRDAGSDHRSVRRRGQRDRADHAEDGLIQKPLRRTVS